MRGEPEKARATRASAPLAAAKAATPMDSSRNGAVSTSAVAVNSALAIPCEGATANSTDRISPEASHTRWSVHARRAAEKPRVSTIAFAFMS